MMRESISVIKWCGLICIVFLVLTYAVTVNSEGNFITVDSVWISNSFLITLFGGVFASMLVVVLCEMQKYWNSKTNTEQFLFYQSFYLYQALMQMKTIIEDYLNHNEWRISENLLDESVRMIQSEMNALQVTDYATFKHDENTLMVEHGKFRIETLPRIQPLMQSGVRLKLAINETDMEYLQNQLTTHTYSGASRKITAKSPKVAQMLNNELDTISSAIALVDNYISILNNHCNNRYKWNDVKSKLVFQHFEGSSI